MAAGRHARRRPARSLVVGALRYCRGVNATISSLLLAYIAIAVFNFLVEGPLRDPASLNKPSTYPIPDDVHDRRACSASTSTGAWPSASSSACCAWILMDHTTFGFAARMVGGNVRAAQAAGLPVGRLILVTCFLGGAAAGLAGMVEIAAVASKANATLAGRLRLHRHPGLVHRPPHPLGDHPGRRPVRRPRAPRPALLQRHLQSARRLGQVLMGIMFVMILLVRDALRPLPHLPAARDRRRCRA